MKKLFIALVSITVAQAQDPTSMQMKQEVEETCKRK